MRVLGIDPGSRHTGYGVIDLRGSSMRPLGHGRLSVADEPALPPRLARLARETGELVRRFRPDIAVLETPFYGRSARSLIVLAQARGALVATLALAEVEIREYSPAEIKTAVTGSGRADKQQVESMVRRTLGLGEARMSADAADALAVAICFGARSRLDLLASAKEAPRGRPRSRKSFLCKD